MSFDVYNTERGLMEAARGRLNQGEIDRQGLNLNALQSGLSGAVDLSGQQLSAQQSALQGALGQGDLRLGSAGTRADIANAQSQAELQKIGLLNQFGGQQDALAQALSLAPQAQQDARFNELSQFNALLNPNGAAAGAPKTNKTASAIGGAATGAAAGFMAGGPVGAAVGGAGGLIGGYFA